MSIPRQYLIAAIIGLVLGIVLGLALLAVVPTANAPWPTVCATTVDGVTTCAWITTTPLPAWQPATVGAATRFTASVWATHAAETAAAPQEAPANSD